MRVSFFVYIALFLVGCETTILKSSICHNSYSDIPGLEGKYFSNLEEVKVDLEITKENEIGAYQIKMSVTNDEPEVSKAHTCIIDDTVVIESFANIDEVGEELSGYSVSRVSLFQNVFLDISTLVFDKKELLNLNIPFQFERGDLDTSITLIDNSLVSNEQLFKALDLDSYSQPVMFFRTKSFNQNE